MAQLYFYICPVCGVGRHTWWGEVPAAMKCCGGPHRKRQTAKAVRPCDITERLLYSLAGLAENRAQRKEGKNAT